MSGLPCASSQNDDPERDGSKDEPFAGEYFQFYHSLHRLRARFDSLKNINAHVRWNPVSSFFQNFYTLSISYTRRARRLMSNRKRRVRCVCVQILLWVLFIAWMRLIAILARFIGEEHLYGFGGCTPAGDFLPPSEDDYNKWDIENIFQITVGFGSLSFATAKAIDVCWDVVVSRGGQAILVGVAYVVYTSTLVRTMENSAVSYRTFAALTFEAATLTTIFRLAQDFWTNTAIRARLAVFWIILSSMWVAAFPTYTSAMTGYAANTGSFVTARDQSLTPYIDL